MIDHPIIDAHLHIWDTSLFRYPWLNSIPRLNRSFNLDEYNRHCKVLAVEAMVFIQCEADPAYFKEEANWVAKQALGDPRIKAIVAWAPLEKGNSVENDLSELSRHKILRGIRRIIQYEDDIDFCLRPDFIDGVHMLASFDLSFDICVDYRQMANAIKFAAKVPEVPMVLDHLGKPDIKGGKMRRWASEIREMASLPHVFCKLSGVATEADHQAWTADELKRYIDVAVDAFGFDRLMFGSDWPVLTQAVELTHWVNIVAEVLNSVDESERRKVWRDNTIRFYRLEM